MQAKQVFFAFFAVQVLSLQMYFIQGKQPNIDIFYYYEFVGSFCEKALYEMARCFISKLNINAAKIKADLRIYPLRRVL